MLLATLSANYNNPSTFVMSKYNAYVAEAMHLAITMIACNHACYKDITLESDIINDKNNR